MKTAFKLRFYPRPEQERALAQWFGHARFVCNLGLEMRSKAYRRRGESVTGNDVQKWLGTVPVSCLQQSLRDQDTAYKNFFEGRANYPRFKKRRSAQSARVTMDWRSPTRTRAWESGQLKLPGLGHVRLRGRKLPKARPKMVTVKRDACGRYFVSLTVDVVQPAPFEAEHASVGVDADTRHLAVTSRGERYENPKALERHAAKLKRQQQRLARQIKGSNRRARTRTRIARCHARIADCRREAVHRASDHITRQNHVVCGESLNVKGMTATARGNARAPGKKVAQKSGLNRSVLDAAFGEMSRQLQYKCARHGHVFVGVSQWFPSSKRCCACGARNTSLTLAQTTWTCPVCETVHDRDVNAARNIETEGLRILAESAGANEPTDETPRGYGEGLGPRHRTEAVRASGVGSEGLTTSGSADVSARITRAVQAPSGTA